MSCDFICINRKMGFTLLQRRKLLFSNEPITYNASSLQSIMNTGLWKIGKEFYGQMRPRIGSDGKVYIWKERKEPLSDRTTSPTVKHGGGGNLMAWGGVWWTGVRRLIAVQ